eukprot:Clim_evm11s217 gene=Clim_evmTU11s217
MPGSLTNRCQHGDHTPNSVDRAAERFAQELTMARGTQAIKLCDRAIEYLTMKLSGFSEQAFVSIVEACVGVVCSPVVDREVKPRLLGALAQAYNHGCTHSRDIEHAIVYHISTQPEFFCQFKETFQMLAKIGTASQFDVREKAQEFLFRAAMGIHRGLFKPACDALQAVVKEHKVAALACMRQDCVWNFEFWFDRVQQTPNGTDAMVRWKFLVYVLVYDFFSPSFRRERKVMLDWISRMFERPQHKALAFKQWSDVVFAFAPFGLSRGQFRLLLSPYHDKLSDPSNMSPWIWSSAVESWWKLLHGLVFVPDVRQSFLRLLNYVVRGVATERVASRAIWFLAENWDRCRDTICSMTPLDLKSDSVERFTTLITGLSTPDLEHAVPEALQFVQRLVTTLLNSPDWQSAEDTTVLLNLLPTVFRSAEYAYIVNACPDGLITSHLGRLDVWHELVLHLNTDMHTGYGAGSMIWFEWHLINDGCRLLLEAHDEEIMPVYVTLLARLFGDFFSGSARIDAIDGSELVVLQQDSLQIIMSSECVLGPAAIEATFQRSSELLGHCLAMTRKEASNSYERAFKMQLSPVIEDAVCTWFDEATDPAWCSNIPIEYLDSISVLLYEAMKSSSSSVVKALAAFWNMQVANRGQLERMPAVTSMVSQEELSCCIDSVTSKLSAHSVTTKVQGVAKKVRINEERNATLIIPRNEVSLQAALTSTPHEDNVVVNVAWQKPRDVVWHKDASNLKDSTMPLNDVLGDIFLREREGRRICDALGIRTVGDLAKFPSSRRWQLQLSVHGSELTRYLKEVVATAQVEPTSQGHSNTNRARASLLAELSPNSQTASTNHHSITCSRGAFSGRFRPSMQSSTTPLSPPRFGQNPAEDGASTPVKTGEQSNHGRSSIVTISTGTGPQFDGCATLPHSPSDGPNGPTRSIDNRELHQASTPAFLPMGHEHVTYSSRTLEHLRSNIDHGLEDGPTLPRYPSLPIRIETMFGGTGYSKQVHLKKAHTSVSTCRAPFFWQDKSLDHTPPFGPEGEQLSLQRPDLRLTMHLPFLPTQGKRVCYTAGALDLLPRWHTTTDAYRPAVPLDEFLPAVHYKETAVIDNAIAKGVDVSSLADFTHGEGVKASRDATKMGNTRPIATSTGPQYGKRASIRNPSPISTVVVVRTPVDQSSIVETSLPGCRDIENTFANRKRSRHEQDDFGCSRSVKVPRPSNLLSAEAALTKGEHGGDSPSVPLPNIAGKTNKPELDGTPSGSLLSRLANWIGFV